MKTKNMYNYFNQILFNLIFAFIGLYTILFLYVNNFIKVILLILFLIYLIFIFCFAVFYKKKEILLQNVKKNQIKNVLFFISIFLTLIVISLLKYEGVNQLIINYILLSSGILLFLFSISLVIIELLNFKKLTFYVKLGR